MKTMIDREQGLLRRVAVAYGDHPFRDMPARFRWTGLTIMKRAINTLGAPVHFGHPGRNFRGYGGAVTGAARLAGQCYNADIIEAELPLGPKVVRVPLLLADVELDRRAGPAMWNYLLDQAEDNPGFGMSVLLNYTTTGTGASTVWLPQSLYSVDAVDRPAVNCGLWNYREVAPPKPVAPPSPLRRKTRGKLERVSCGMFGG